MTVRSLLFIASITVLILVVLPPFLSVEWRFMVLQAFSSLCHQIPERSFHVHDVSLAVCHRCTGIYAGVPFAMLVMTITKGWGIRKHIWAVILFSSIAIMGLDWGLTVVGVWENTLYSRASTGLLFGLAAGGYLALVLTPRRRSTTIDNP